ncbi:hypothetical protein MSAN_02130100 [Mycena sanguinolenta]|uniref:Uncharacterized protein n=1 Tax=Mycena sanguinolenta TaxID=230812 RepID=A0A8H7CLL5_9AGAR|nr:hypothetical protein MSAN_02130100 [Mycena sanguinolenta]
MVNLTAFAAATGLLLVDYQNNVLDSSFASAVNNNPVISSPRNIPATTNQQWNLVPSETSPGTFNFQSLLGSTFLSYSNVASGGPSRFAQATLHSTLPANFILQQLSDTSLVLFEVISNTTLTSWPVQPTPGLVAPPVTYEVFHGAPGQFWKTTAADGGPL